MFDDRRVDTSGVDDRRGRGAGIPIAVGGGGGVVALILYLVVTLLGGGDTASLVPEAVGTADGAPSDLRTRCNTDGAIERYDDCYVVKSYNEVNEVWESRLRGYTPPGLVFFEQGTSTACGSASSSVGPFYCPADQRVYIDLGFLAELQQRFGAPGRYAQTYIVAHEVGHHIQALSGTAERVVASGSQSMSIGLELQADCFAGAWSALADQAGNVRITERELDQALGAAAAVGDDRIQQRTQGRVNPEQWTHGSAEQRRGAFLSGYRASDPAACESLVPAR